MKGVFPILSTPFDSKDNIIYEDVHSEVEYAIESGVNGAFLSVSNSLARSGCVFLIEFRPSV